MIAVSPTMIGEAVVRSVDHPKISGLSVAGKHWAVQRSGGYKGTGLQPASGRSNTVPPQGANPCSATPQTAFCGAAVSVL